MNCDKELAAFCENIKRIRLEKGLTQKEMSEILRLSACTYSKIEKGKISNRVGADVLIYINRAFGIMPSEMFDKSIF